MGGVAGLDDRLDAAGDVARGRGHGEAGGDGVGPLLDAGELAEGDQPVGDEHVDRVDVGRVRCVQVGLRDRLIGLHLRLHGGRLGGDVGRSVSGHGRKDGRLGGVGGTGGRVGQLGVLSH